jgi:3-mercaptopyruvate sulfurtransferase SseA
MKTGVILYVLGNDDLEPAVDLEKEVKKLGIEADRVELVSQNAGHLDVSEAWWLLTAGGMQRILCSLGQLTDSGHLQLTGRVLRLAG